MLAGWSLAAHLRGKGVLSFNYAVFKVLCKPNARAFVVAFAGILGWNPNSI
jgi:hypothetical protein